MLQPCFSFRRRKNATSSSSSWLSKWDHSCVMMTAILLILLFTSLNHDTTGFSCRWRNGNLWAAWLRAHPPPWSIVLDHPCCSAHPVGRGAGLDCWRKPQAGWFFYWVETQKAHSRVAEVGSLSARAKCQKKIVRRIFAVFATNASFLHVAADMQIRFSIIYTM